MKSSILLVLVGIALLCKVVTPTILDAWRTDPNINSNVTFPLLSSAYSAGQIYESDKVENATIVGNRADPFLVFRQRDLHIALTSKTSTATGGQLAFTFQTDGFSNFLNLATPSNAGGVFTVVYDDVDTLATLSTNCTSTFGNPVLLDSPSCADVSSGGIKLRSDANAIDLTKGGTNFAFNIPFVSVSPPSSTFAVVIRVWGAAGTTSYLRLDYATDMQQNQLLFDFFRFEGQALFGTVVGFAVQFELGPGQNITIAELQAVGVSIVKTMILYDVNEDGIANPGEQVNMTVQLSKPFLPTNAGSWDFSWADPLSDLVSVDTSSVQFYTDESEPGINPITQATSAGNFDTVSLQLTAEAGSIANSYFVTFLTTVRPLPDSNVRNLTNAANLTFSLSSVNTTFNLVAFAPRIPVAGAPILTLLQTCPAITGPGEQAVIEYTVVNNGTADAQNVQITQFITPSNAQVVSSFDPDWSCTRNLFGEYQCVYAFPTALPRPSIGGALNTFFVNFTFTLSDSIDCTVNGINVQARLTSQNPNNNDYGGYEYSYEDTVPNGKRVEEDSHDQVLSVINKRAFYVRNSNCSVALQTSVNLTLTTTIVGTDQTTSSGQIVYYELRYANTGASSAYDIMIYDVLPPSTYAVVPPSSNSWVCDNSTNVCVLTDSSPLAPGSSRTAPLIGLYVQNSFNSPFLCNSFNLTTSPPVGSNSQFCNTNDQSNVLCIPVVPNDQSSNSGGSSNECSASPSPCVYCLAGSTINISMKSLLPAASGSCAGGSCTRRR